MGHVSINFVVKVSYSSPPILVSALARLCRAAGLHRRISFIGNIGVSNVPGPPVQLFVGGAAVSAMFVPDAIVPTFPPPAPVCVTVLPLAVVVGCDGCDVAPPPVEAFL